MLRECGGTMVTKMLVWGLGGVVGMSTGHEYVGDTRVHVLCITHLT